MTLSAAFPRTTLKIFTTCPSIKKYVIIIRFNNALKTNMNMLIDNALMSKVILTYNQK